MALIASIEEMHIMKTPLSCLNPADSDLYSRPLQPKKETQTS